mmetsp:Transcript_32267/g.57048  ORF Transcript_32267/g.57048 Transcript_32267/m.57048 type:complete len:80 (+) Transcript_32267:71-310(+)
MAPVQEADWHAVSSDAPHLLNGPIDHPRVAERLPISKLSRSGLPRLGLAATAWRGQAKPAAHLAERLCRKLPALTVRQG